MRCYKSFDELYIDMELESIISSDEVIHIKFDSNKKDMMFLLGVLFAAGKKIQIDNINELKTSEQRSFEKMAAYWHRAKLSHKPTNQNIHNKMFLICSNPNEETKQKLIADIKKITNRGIEVSYLNRNTLTGEDITGYQICVDVANAISNSNIVGLHYNQNTKGIMFELGIAYYFNYINENRRFELLNKDDIKFNLEDFGDRVVFKLVQDQEYKDAIKNNNYQRARFID